jgi:hypothetical protein
VGGGMDAIRVYLLVLLSEATIGKAAIAVKQ